LFPGSLSLPARTDQIHSYHPPIAENGLYWTTQLPSNSVQVQTDKNGVHKVVINISNLAVVDEPKAPLPGPGPFDAVVSLKLTLEAQGFPVGFTNPAQQFRLQFSPARASLEFQASTPSLGFSFKSAPAGKSETIFAILGTEQNGVFF
jgi:hypothetical protein